MKASYYLVIVIFGCQGPVVQKKFGHYLGVKFILALNPSVKSTVDLAPR
jgi:hypothetical protein